MKKIILASTSPRRREILKNTGYIFDIVSPDYDEHIAGKYFSYDLIKKTAERKGTSILEKIKEPAIVISADTVVVHDRIILGKPKNYEEAFSMLSSLQGEKHIVVTGVCVIDSENGNKIVDSETSEVIFQNITEDKIDWYINKFRPFDKAGSYGIQEIPADFIREIKGEYDNIVGLPLKLLKNMLKEITT